MRSLYSAVFLLTVFSSGRLHSQDITSGALFLDLPHNVHQHTVGNAADLEGLKSINTNPAGTTIDGLASQHALHSSVNFSQYPGNLLFTNLSLLYSPGKKIGMFGFVIAYLNYGNIPNIDVDGNESGNVAAYDIYASLNYSREIPWGILIGANVKVIQQRLHTFSATGFAADIGVKKKFNIFKNDLWISISGNHLGPSIRFDQEATPLPSRIHASTSYVMKSWLPSWFYIKIGPQLDYFLENYYDFTLAGEFFFDIRYFSLYALARYKFGSGINQFALGAGGIYKTASYQIEASFGINPIAFSNELIASLAFIYNFKRTKLSQVKPIDFSADLKNSDSEELDKDPGEIIIKLDRPAEEQNKDITDIIEDK